MLKGSLHVRDEGLQEERHGWYAADPPPNDDRESEFPNNRTAFGVLIRYLTR